MNDTIVPSSRYPPTHLRSSQQFIHENVPVVPEDAAADRSIVVFVLQTSTGTRVERLLRDDHFAVMIFVLFAVDETSARGSRICENAVRVHAASTPWVLQCQVPRPARETACCSAHESA